MSDNPEQTEITSAGVAATGAEVKGWRNGLLLLLPSEGNWETVIEQVHTRLDEARARSFWRGAQTTIDCGLREIPLEQLDALLQRLKGGFGLVPVAVVTTNPTTHAAAEKLALTVYDTLPIIKKPGSARDAAGERETAAESATAKVSAAVGAGPVNNALYVPHTVRSGQRVVHDGHLIICGDVNAGAEVMAGGDVLIFGTLRGLAHAGCYGDETARIVAVSLRPPQLRIAAKIARAPEEGTRGGIGSSAGSAAGKNGPEIARIENGEIQLFPL